MSEPTTNAAATATTTPPEHRPSQSGRAVHSLTLFTTGRCNLNCPYCTHAPRRGKYGDYQMSLHELAWLIDRIKSLGLRYNDIVLTGGEPLLWEEIEAGAKMLREAAISKHLTMFTNGMHPEVLAKVAPLFTSITLSVYGRTNAAVAKSLKRRFPHKVKLSHLNHRASPANLLAGVLPAKCNCANQHYLDGRFYVCPNALATCLRYNLDANNPAISCSIDDDFEAHFQAHRQSRFELPMCAGCISNGRVWKRMAHTERRWK